MNNKEKPENKGPIESLAPRLLGMYDSEAKPQEVQRVNEAIKQLEQERRISPEKLVRRASA